MSPQSSVWYIPLMAEGKSKRAKKEQDLLQARIDSAVSERIRDVFQSANKKILDLLTAVESSKNLKVRFENPAMVKCWEAKNCDKTSCPAYGSTDLRCWQTAGTHCGGTVQGFFAEKIGSCEKCEVYCRATADATVEFGEIFNNIMHITEQKAEELRRAKEQLEQSNKTLGLKVEERTQELQSAHNQLVQADKMSAVGQLAAGIAHEINNPLCVILGFAQAIAKSVAQGDPLSEPLRAIERESLRCKSLVKDLLTFSRSSQSSERAPSDLNSVVERAWSLVETASPIKTGAIRVEKRLKPGLPALDANQNQIQQIVVNIANNALHAMPSGGVLAVRTGESAGADGRCVTLEISDTGVGMSEEVRRKIFEPFYTTKKTGEGTGLGLSLVYEIVQGHGGTISVASRPGKGSTFTVSFPVIAPSPPGRTNYGSHAA